MSGCGHWSALVKQHSSHSTNIMSLVSQLCDEARYNKSIDVVESLKRFANCAMSCRRLHFGLHTSVCQSVLYLPLLSNKKSQTESSNLLYRVFIYFLQHICPYSCDFHNNRSKVKPRSVELTNGVQWSRGTNGSALLHYRSAAL